MARVVATSAAVHDARAFRHERRAPPIVVAILAAQHAQPRLAQLLPPDSMGGLDAATALLADAITHDRHIVVVGDFDCDGATACAVGVRGLRMLGARRVSHAVAN